jgi:hypothetical protein
VSRVPPGSDPGHATTLVSHAGWSAEIDTAIADLVLELWRAGVGTSQSCEDRDGRAWIRMTRPSANRLIALLEGDHERLLSVEHPGHGPEDVYFDLADVPELLERLRASRPEAEA